MLAYHANSSRSSQRRRKDFRLLFEGNIQVGPTFHGYKNTVWRLFYLVEYVYN